MNSIDVPKEVKRDHHDKMDLLIRMLINPTDPYSVNVTYSEEIEVNSYE